MATIPNIAHQPILNTDRVCEFYAKKDGVPISYVGTSALGEETYAMDIFYRDTPHPEFGNFYFGLGYIPMKPGLRIWGADKIETHTFTMVLCEGKLHYSRHRHDCVSAGDVSVDGGRAYSKFVGKIDHSKIFELKLVNGMWKYV